jgi:hypothetical protein
MNFNYGELTLIWDALERLPRSYRISYRDGKVKFDPVSVDDVKKKVMALAKEIEEQGETKQ